LTDVTSDEKMHITNPFPESMLTLLRRISAGTIGRYHHVPVAQISWIAKWPT